MKETDILIKNEDEKIKERYMTHNNEVIPENEVPLHIRNKALKTEIDLTIDILSNAINDLTSLLREKAERVSKLEDSYK